MVMTNKQQTLDPRDRYSSEQVRYAYNAIKHLRRRLRCAYSVNALLYLFFHHIAEFFVFFFLFIGYDYDSYTTHDALKDKIFLNISYFMSAYRK